jgi:hypothetical protein
MMQSTGVERPAHYGYSIVQLILSLLTTLMLWGVALLFMGLGVVSGVSGMAGLGEGFPGGGAGLLLLAGNFGACGLLLLPSAYYAWQRVAGHPAPAGRQTPAWLRPTRLILALPLVLLAGYFVAQNPNLSFLLPPLHVLAVGLPVLWIVYLAARGLPSGSPQRAWGVFGSGMVLGPALIMVLEILALVVCAGLAIAFVTSQPDLVEMLNSLVAQLTAGQIDQEGLVNALVPWLVKPGVIIAAILFAAVIVPLIEEAIKPIGVWLLAGFGLSPAAGFALGAISGAGYALFESLLLSSTGEGWIAVVVARMSTGVIHILNTGLMGWALASAWREKRYLRLGATYLFVVSLHGLWNGLSVFNAIYEALGLVGVQPAPKLVSWIGPLVPYLLAGITVAVFALMLVMNRNLRWQVQRTVKSMEK